MYMDTVHKHLDNYMHLSLHKNLPDIRKVALSKTLFHKTSTTSPFLGGILSDVFNFFVETTDVLHSSSNDMSE